MTSGHEHERLAAFLDGELPPAERSEVAAHLEACAECAERLRLWAAADDMVASSPVDTPPGYFEAFPGRVRARLEPRRRLRLPAWAWAAAAALLLAVVTPLTWRERREPALREASRPAAEPESQAPAAPPPSAQPAQPGTLATPALTTPQGARPGGGADAAAAKEDPANALGERAQERRGEGAARGDDETRAQRQKREGFAAAPSAAPAPQARDEGPPREADAASAGAGLLSAERARAPEPASPIEPQQPSAATSATNAPEPAPGRPQAEAPKAAEAKAARERAGAASDAGLERGRVMRPPPAGAAGPHVVVEEEWHRLESTRPETAAGWRELREAWRRFAARETEGAIAEAALLRLVETARAAYGASGDAADLAVFRADARAYLARERAPQKDRVRRLLEELGGGER